MCLIIITGLGSIKNEARLMHVGVSLWVITVVGPGTEIAEAGMVVCECVI